MEFWRTTSPPKRWALLLFVDKRTLVIWSIWAPPSVGNGSSVFAQLERALSENFAMALRHSMKLANSSSPHSTGRSLLSVRPMICRVYSIKRCINILTRIRIADMQSLIVEFQGHFGMLLKVARIPPLASKIIGPRQSRKDDLTLPSEHVSLNRPGLGEV